MSWDTCKGLLLSHSGRVFPTFVVSKTRAMKAVSKQNSVHSSILMKKLFQIMCILMSFYKNVRSRRLSVILKWRQLLRYKSGIIDNFFLFPGCNLWRWRWWQLSTAWGTVCLLSITSCGPHGALGPREGLFLLFAVVVLHRAFADTEIANTEERTALGGNMRLGSPHKPLVTIFSSTHQSLTLFYMCFHLKVVYWIHIADSLPLNS